MNLREEVFLLQNMFNREKENRLPEPHKANLLWEFFYNAADTGDHERAQRNLERIREDYGVTPELERDLRDGKYGDRLKEIVLEAHARIGDITKEEKKFIYENFDRVRKDTQF